ncbi:MULTISPECIES: hypothetical protein [unclassified Pusillimonas]|jgi:hypothetical protein|uniref:hypothetical protein n=1 Tax=unclassified Pusillimonas TaxID=2640016 RepID=UPI000B9C84B5|nr:MULTISPECIES: hypothetical protein [unclassified Pusillimonas]OXR50088.1 hypothetical protein PuT2_04800 [Pusillimonas sp. T2]ROT46531.1 hypothetical protein CHR62_00925 [Pusillimonas sp. NJUB218]
MDLSVEAVVNTALALEGATVQQNQQMLLLRKTLESQAQVMQQLMAPLEPKLATSGAVGTRLHAVA